jgi:dsRNA-specific ribonuclease
MSKESLEKYVSVLGKILDKCKGEYSELFLANEKIAEGSGHAKQEAEQSAAQAGLDKTGG